MMFPENSGKFRCEMVFNHPRYRYRLIAYDEFAIQLPGEWCHVLTEWMQIDSDNVLYIKDGYCWDGPSGPTVNTNNTILASLVHDALYQLIRLGRLPSRSRKQADKVFYTILRIAGMSWFRAKYYYAAVRAFGWIHSRPEQEPQEPDFGDFQPDFLIREGGRYPDSTFDRSAGVFRPCECGCDSTFRERIRFASKDGADSADSDTGDYELAVLICSQCKKTRWRFVVRMGSGKHPSQREMSYAV